MLCVLQGGKREGIESISEVDPGLRGAKEVEDASLAAILGPLGREAFDLWGWLSGRRAQLGPALGLGREICGILGTDGRRIHVVFKENTSWMACSTPHSQDVSTPPVG